MNSEEYIKDRLEPQQIWYGKKSTLNKGYYNWIKIVTLVFSLSIPLLSLIEQYFEVELEASVIAAIFGSLIAFLTSMASLLKFKEKWINYRTASERLKREKYLWATGTLPYHEGDVNTLLVQRVEGIINLEHGDWSSYIISDPAAN